MSEYIRAIRRRWWFLLVACLAAALAAAVVTIQTPPRYATTVTFFANTPNRGVNEAFQGNLLSQQRVKSYADLLTGDRLAKMIDRRYKLGLSVPEIQRRIQARPVPNTVLLRVTVTDGQPARSAQLAAALVTEFVDLVQVLERTGQGDGAAVAVSVVDGPTLNPVPVSPRPTRNIGLGVLLGLLAGCAAAVLRENLDTTVKTAEVLTKATGAPALGVIPLDATARKAPLIVAAKANSPRAEAFRQIRTNLTFVDVDRPVRSIVVSSAERDEGKSTTSCNLAIALATAGEKVLLVEADLRRPRLGHYLGLEGAMGLSNALAGQVDVDQVIQPWGHGLWVLLCGSLPPNPSELLGSDAMRDMLDVLTARYDRVIIDTPPLLPVTDAAVVAARADGVVLVARSARTTQDQARKASQAMLAVGAHVIGGVLTMQRTGPGGEGYYGGYYEQDQRHPWHRRPAASDAARPSARPERYEPGQEVGVPSGRAAP
ncbi:polysaccharide biosynthesis tyrosine autokinase [Luedemannella flava]|uniref:polysaccharide biosynthesis tyrosine autokinase n=1 Tax=Luedemannella flava TaxID=349316 RepID=UPI003CD06A9D